MQLYIILTACAFWALIVFLVYKFRENDSLSESADRWKNRALIAEHRQRKAEEKTRKVYFDSEARISELERENTYLKKELRRKETLLGQKWGGATLERR